MFGLSALHLEVPNSLLSKMTLSCFIINHWFLWCLQRYGRCPPLNRLRFCGIFIITSCESGDFNLNPEYPTPKKLSHIPHHESENQIDRTKLSFKQIAWINVSTHFIWLPPNYITQLTSSLLQSARWCCRSDHRCLSFQRARCYCYTGHLRGGVWELPEVPVILSWEPMGFTHEKPWTFLGIMETHIFL